MALSAALKRTVSQTQARLSRGGDRMKPKEGRNVYRIVDPTPVGAPWIGEDGAFWREVGMQWIKLEPNGKPIAVVGNREIAYNEPDPIAQALQVAIEAQVDEESKKFFKDMQSRTSIWINAIERTTKSDSQDVGVLELTKTAFTEILNLIQIYDDQGLDLFDPTTGCDLVITRTGKGLDTKYSVQVQPGVSRPITNEVLSKCTDLHALMERELFKGEEQKALNAISSASGIPLPRLIGHAGGANLTLASRTPTPALTSAAVQVPGAQVAAAAPVAAPVATTPVAPPPAVAQPVVPATPADDPTIAALRRQLAAAEAAAKAAPVAAAPAAAPVVAEDPAPFVQDTSTSAEEDDILKELENL